jgi:hypothetical protein
VNTGNPNAICQASGELVAITVLRPREALPLSEMAYVSRLMGDRWLDAPLPEHEATPDEVHVEGCTGKGILVRASGPPIDEGRSTRWLLELDLTTDAWRWRDGSRVVPFPDQQELRATYLGR